MENKNHTYYYNFYFSDNINVNFEINIDIEKKIYINNLDTPKEFKSFTNLEINKCQNCPLKKEEFPECPVAKNILAITYNFKDHFSYDEVLIKVFSPRRTYSKKVDTQKGLQSILGLVMSGSLCPHFDFLRPMTLFHLPFSDNIETFFRVTGFYLIGKWLSHPNQKMDINDLLNHYKELEIVNKGILSRIKTIETYDASQNAVVILQSFIDIFSMEFEFGLEEYKEFYKLK
jgi:hypothetical protein